MPTEHTVRQGEHLAALALRYGFASHETVWNAPENAPLRALRADPSLLLPGDVVTIPDRDTRTRPVATRAKHRFVVATDALELRLHLEDPRGKPAGQRPCTLTVDGREHALETDGDGLVTVTVARDAQRATLVVDEVTYELHVGALDPYDTPSGARGRLANLGYYPAEPDDDDPALLRLAIELFQRDQKLAVDGELSPSVHSALRDAHGC